MEPGKLVPLPRIRLIGERFDQHMARTLLLGQPQQRLLNGRMVHLTQGLHYLLVGQRRQADLGIPRMLLEFAFQQKSNMAFFLRRQPPLLD